MGDSRWAQAQRTARGKFAHKGTFGHALLIAGAHGTIGAAILAAARACLRSGVGLLTVHSSNCGLSTFSAAPEAMVHTDANERVWARPLMPRHATPLESAAASVNLPKPAMPCALLHSLAQQPKPPKPLVLDADALNIASRPDLLALLPPTASSRRTRRNLSAWSRICIGISQPTRCASGTTHVCTALRCDYRTQRAHTCTALPDGRSFTTPRATRVLAKGGSGDALTSVILAHLAQGLRAIRRHQFCVSIYMAQRVIGRLSYSAKQRCYPVI